MANKISVVIDVVHQTATRGVKSFSAAVKDADTTVGKFKAGASNALTQVKANAGVLAAAGGAALVQFGLKSVQAFNDLAIESGKLSDALGMPVEEASKLIEVAGDVGIEVGTLESTIGKMNRTAASTPEAFDDIGAAIARNADGTINVNETFLNAVDALNKIPDASKRAEAAQKIFGRSWQDIAELVGQGSDQIRASLAEVSEQKIVDEDELRKAREQRAAMDALNDAVQDFMLTVGQHLTPALTKAADKLAKVLDIAQKLKILDMAEVFSAWARGIEPFVRIVDTATGKTDLMGRSIHRVTDEQLEFVKAAKDAGLSAEEVNKALAEGITSWAQYEKKNEDAYVAATKNANAQLYLGQATAGATTKSQGYANVLDRVGRALDWATQKFDAMSRRLSDRAAYLNAEAGLQALADQAVKTGDVTELQVIDMKQQVLDYGRTLNDEASKERIAEINTAIDQGDYNLALLALSYLERDRTVRLNVAMGSARNVTNTGRIGGIPVFDSGGVVPGPRGSDQLIMAHGGETVLPTHKRGASAFGGGVNIHIHAGTFVTEQQVGKYLKQVLDRYGRNGGT